MTTLNVHLVIETRQSVWIQIARVENDEKGQPHIKGFVYGYDAPVPDINVCFGRIVSIQHKECILIETGRFASCLLAI